MSRIITATLTALLLATGTSLTAADGHGHDHKGHDHAAMTAVGNVTLGTITAKVEAAGAPVLGKEWILTVDLPAGTAAPKAIRVWVGIESGRGSAKAKAEPEARHPGGHEAHVDVPAPLPADSKLWVSLEDTAGVVTKASLTLPALGKAEEKKKDDHHGHDHK